MNKFVEIEKIIHVPIKIPEIIERNIEKLVEVKTTSEKIV